MPTGRRTRGEANRAVAGEIKAERVRQKLSDPLLTQRGLADRAEIKLDTMKSIETGRAQVDIDQLFAIADALGVSPSELTRRAEERLGQTTVAVGETEVVYEREKAD